jgi:hypothetical protein
MEEENRLSDHKRHMIEVFNRVGLGSIIILWGSLLALRQAGMIDKGVSTLPFILVAFGILLVFGGVYRLYAHQKPTRA